MSHLCNKLAGGLLAGLLAACGPGEPPPAPTAGADPAQAPQVAAPWIRSAPPAASVMAGYLRFEAGGTAVTITGAECAGFGTTELHESAEVDGVATMRELARVEVPAGGSIDFAPGGKHLMLMSPTAIPAAGETVACTLLLADGTRLEFDAPVRRNTGDESHDHHHH
jgi:copper(I)-binding protein